MAKCKYCGADIDPSSTFCPVCYKSDPFNKPEEEQLKTEQDKTNKHDFYKYHDPDGRYAILPLNDSPVKAEPELDKISGLAIAGFVCSFVVPIIGLPFSITAYRRSVCDNYKTNRRYAKAGIIISIVILVLLIILFPIILVAAF